MRGRSLFVGVLSLIAIPALTQAGGFSPAAAALEVATNSGVCGELGVLEASYRADGTIAAVCNEDPTAFLPLVGALGPALGLGAAAVAVAAVASSGGDDSSTPDTQ